MRWKLVQWITVKATDLSGILLRKRNWSYSADDYRRMPLNSIGHQLITYMDRHNIPFKPNLVRHDVKHILLGYEMNMPDELRIHAFLLGNRCYNPLAITYLAICTAVVPEVIPTLKKDFVRGRKAVCLRAIPIQDHLRDDLNVCKQLWGL